MTSLDPDFLTAIALFGFVSSITPGPNNTMLLASGANYGLVRTLPHLAGVVLGFAVMLGAVGLGLGALFAAHPWLHTALKIVGGLYLVWLAIKIATSSSIGAGKATGAPMTFVQALAFQWVNPKAWAMGLGAVTTFAPRDNYLAGIAALTVVFAVVNAPSVFVWASMGALLRRWLERPGVLKGFNIIMAALLVASLYPLGLEAWRWGMGLSFAP